MQFQMWGVNNIHELSNPQSFNTDRRIVFCLVDEIYQPAVSPLEHAFVRHKEIPHPDFEFRA